MSLYLTNLFLGNTMLCYFKLECALVVVHSNYIELLINQSLCIVEKFTVSTFVILGLRHKH